MCELYVQACRLHGSICEMQAGWHAMALRHCNRPGGEDVEGHFKRILQQSKRWVVVVFSMWLR